MIRLIFNNNKSGFTLIEVMIAIVILMVGMLGLLQTVNMTMAYNLRNHLRDSAVYAGERYMNDLRAKPFDKLSSSYATLDNIPANIRGTNHKLKIERSTQDLGTTSKQLTVVVKWKYRDEEFQNNVQSVVSKQ